MGEFGFLWPLLRRRAGWLLVSLALALVTLVAGLGLLAVSGWLLAGAALAGLAATVSFELFRPAALVRLCALSRTGGRYGERVVSHEATFRLLADLRVWFYARLAPLAPGSLQGFRSGELLNRLVADIQSLDNLFLRVLAPSVSAVCIGAGLYWLLGQWSWWWANAVVGCMTLAGVAVPALAARLGASSGAALSEELGRLRAELVETLQGLAEVLVYGAGEHRLQALAERELRYLALQRQMNRLQAGSAALQTLLSGLALWAALFIGTELVATGHLTGPLLAGLALTVLAAFEAVQPLPLAYQFLGQTRASARRLREVLDTPPTVVFPAHSARLPTHFELMLRGVSFAYRPGEPPVLRDLDLCVPAGGRLAVMGPSGAGKSTLAQLLVRFFDPTSGMIHLGGVDLSSFAETDLRRLVGMVSQRSHLFSASVRDNLLMARPDATEKALWQALEGARLADTVAALPAGLDTWLGESGMRLSGGQIRRLVVARMLLRDPPILILDEPTEGLDAATADELLAALDTLMTGRTVILISHRLQDLVAVERLALLEEGRLLGEGPVAEMCRHWPQLAELGEPPGRS